MTRMGGMVLWRNNVSVSLEDISNSVQEPISRLRRNPATSQPIALDAACYENDAFDGNNSIRTNRQIASVQQTSSTLAIPKICILSDVQDVMSSQFIFPFRHTCPPSREDDPITGIFVQSSIAHHCCAMKAYIDLSIKLPTFSVKGTLTRFGERLYAIDQLYGVQIDDVISESWLDARPTDKDSLIHKQLRLTRHIDEDHVEWCFEQCSLCFAECRFVRKPSCCRRAACQACWQGYVKSVANEIATTSSPFTSYNLSCYGCSKLVPYKVALACTEPCDMALIRPQLSDDKISTRCPACLKTAPPVISLIRDEDEDISIGSFDEKAAALLKRLRHKKGGHPFACDRCGNVFCRLCGQENHPPTSCDQLTSSDSVFRDWSKKKTDFANPDFPNGRFCPSCRIPISHSGGCAHMKCPCGAEFCYLCGRKYFDFPFLWKHSTSSKLLPLVTCPKLWKSKSKRILVHSMVSFGLVAGVAPFLLVTSPVTVPALFMAYFIKKHYKKKRTIVF